MKALAPITLKKGEGPISPEGTGTLYIASNPANATIFIGGVFRGSTNQFVHNIPAGNRNLTLTKDGYQVYTTTVSVLMDGTRILAPVFNRDIADSNVMGIKLADRECRPMRHASPSALAGQGLPSQ